MILVPDAIEPRIGWRAWDVIELDGALRLCSLAFWSVWLPRQEVTATCRRSVVDAALTGLPPHAAPQARCTCGIYATQTASQVLAFSRGVRQRLDTVHRVVGTASLWGTIVECEGGWRGAFAYPAAIYVPAVRSRPRLRVGRFRRPDQPLQEIAVGLGDYGVPVEVIDAATDRELARLLEPERPSR